MRQKSGVKWTTEGDNNTKFFHSMMKVRIRRNEILEVRNSQGQIVNDAGGIKQKLWSILMHDSKVKIIMV